jgi:hypothetical protein
MLTHELNVWAHPPGQKRDIDLRPASMVKLAAEGDPSNVPANGLPAFSIVSSCNHYIKDVDISITVDVAASGVFRVSELRTIG